MYKLFKTLILFGSFGLLAFSCDPSGNNGEDYLIEELINLRIVDPISGKNLVDTSTMALYHPDSIEILDSNLNSLDLHFSVASPDTLPEYGVTIYLRPTIEERNVNPLDMPVKIYYFKLNESDIDTLKLSYEYKLEGIKEHYNIVVNYNGYLLTDRNEFGEGSGFTSLPKFNH